MVCFYFFWVSKLFTKESRARISNYDLGVSASLGFYTLHTRPITTLRRLLSNTIAKVKDRPENRQGAVYKEYKELSLSRDWWNTNEQQEMVMSTITLLKTIYRRNIKSTRTLLSEMHKYFTDCYQRITLKSWSNLLLSYNKRHRIVLNSYFHRTNDLLTGWSKTIKYQQVYSGNCKQLSGARSPSCRPGSVQLNL